MTAQPETLAFPGEQVQEECSHEQHVPVWRWAARSPCEGQMAYFMKKTLDPGSLANAGSIITPAVVYDGIKPLNC